MANNRSIKKRQLLLLNHLFDEIYEEPIVESKHIISLDNPYENATYNDYYRTVSGDSADYGNKPLPKYIRFNDVVGIRYKINKLIRTWKEDLKAVIAGGISADDLEEIEYSTLVKELNALADRDHILVKSDNKNIKRKSFYFPNETIFGYDRLLDYLYLLPLSPKDDYGISCRELAYSAYSKIVLNREYVIQNMRKKGMTLKWGLGNIYPYRGRYKKVYECPEPLKKLITMCDELKTVLPDISCSDSFVFQKTTHQVIDDLKKDANTYLSRIDGIMSALSDAKENKDQLARLHPKEWFVLDPDSKLRREAKWVMLELSEEDEIELLNLYARYQLKKPEEIPDEERKAFFREYIDRVEIDVLYTLSMISNSYWALMYFHCYNADNFYKMETTGIDPYERLPGPSVANRTGNYGMDDIFWDKQLYRFAMFDYSMMTNTRHPDGPALMGIGPIEYNGEIIPTTFSFRITPYSFFTANGLLTPDHDSSHTLDIISNLGTRKMIEKKVYGSYYNQTYLYSLLSVRHYHWCNIDEVLNRVLLEIDFKGNCSRKKEDYLKLFKDERPKYARR